MSRQPRRPARRADRMARKVPEESVIEHCWSALTGADRVRVSRKALEAVVTTRSPRTRSRPRPRHAVVASLAVVLTASSVACADPAPTTQPGNEPPGKPGDQPNVEHLADAWAQRALQDMSLEQKIGQLFVADVWGQAADEPNAGNQEKYGVSTPAEVVDTYQVGGVIYFNNNDKDNVSDPGQLARLSNGLQRAAMGTGTRLPLSLSVDQEGGRVTRIGAPATEYPSNMAIGAGRNPDDAKQLASVSGHELRAMGIDQNFAPDADVNSNPLNPVIGSRSFSADPELASTLVDAEISGYQSSGEQTATVSSSAKHFPGHGDAATDSHTGLPEIDRTEQRWRETDLPPFKAAVDAGIDSIMTAHIKVPSLDPSGEPATLSKPIISGLLRDELGYDGVVATDSLQMQGVRDMHPDAEIPVLAIEAGVDQMLMPPDLHAAIGGVTDAVHSGRLTEGRIDTSVQRILKLKWKRGVIAKPLVDEQAVQRKVGTPQHHQQLQQITDRTTTLLRNDADTVPMRGKPSRVHVTGWNDPSNPGYPAEPVAALAREFEARQAQTSAMGTGENPDAGAIDQSVQAAQDSNLVVVLTNGLREDSGQRDLVAALQATGKPVVAVSVQEPYDPGYADVPTWLATYDWRDVSMASLAKVLYGETRPQGKLPVNIPDGDDPAQVRYPLGHGLSW